jgi:PTS system galactitol-specific IIC component
MQAISQYLTDLGASVVLPVLITIFGLLLGQKLGRAFRSGLLIGIGFVGIGLVIGLLSTAISPAAQAMVQRFDVPLNVIDVGWPSTSAIAFGSKVGAFAIPVGLAVNLLMIGVGLTRTLDIDLWNYWHIAFTGALVAILTGSFWAGIIAAAIHMVIVLALADWSAPWIQRYYKFPDISFPHGTSAPYVFFAIPLNAAFDRIPGVRNWKADPDAISRRFGIFGESIILGLVLGILIGIAGFGFDDPRADSIAILQLGVNLAAVMLLLPRMVAILMEGLIPISESAREFVQRRFPNRKLYIGLDSALAVGSPAVIATSLLLVPITLLVAIILPGNRVLPFVDLATIPFIVCMMVPLFRGNLVRSVIGGTLVIGGGLWIATAIAATFTTMARDVQFAFPENATQVSSLVDGANPMTGVFYAAGNASWFGLAILAVLALAFAWWVKGRVQRLDQSVPPGGAPAEPAAITPEPAADAAGAPSAATPGEAARTTPSEPAKAAPADPAERRGPGEPRPSTG